MDVVKSTISRLKGIIDIQTVLHFGTKFIVKLPLTLAIIQGVTDQNQTSYLRYSAFLSNRKL